VGFSLGTGHQETRIGVEANRGGGAAILIRALLNACRVYHFHDTSATARVRQYGYVGDNRWLMPDAGNLAAFLYRLQNQDHGTTYNRIVSTIRLFAPFFHDFNLVPSGAYDNEVILNWRDHESDQIFGPHQLSDGTLRAICLVSLLLQPESELPRLIVVDEPELGLHPYALNVVASLLEKASHHAQLLISTQSSSFLDNFDPDDVVVVDREGKESVFTRPDRSSLESWLDEYGLGEVWEKNVIGGGPH
jgi:predicted ATPase